MADELMDVVKDLFTSMFDQQTHTWSEIINQRNKAVANNDASVSFLDKAIIDWHERNTQLSGMSIFLEKVHAKLAKNEAKKDIMQEITNIVRENVSLIQSAEAEVLNIIQTNVPKALGEGLTLLDRLQRLKLGIMGENLTSHLMNEIITKSKIASTSIKTSMEQLVDRFNLVGFEIVDENLTSHLMNERINEVKKDTPITDETNKTENDKQNRELPAGDVPVIEPSKGSDDNYDRKDPLDANLQDGIFNSSSVGDESIANPLKQKPEVNPTPEITSNANNAESPLNQKNDEQHIETTANPSLSPQATVEDNPQKSSEDNAALKRKELEREKKKRDKELRKAMNRLKQEAESRRQEAQSGKNASQGLGQGPNESVVASLAEKIKSKRAEQEQMELERQELDRGENVINDIRNADEFRLATEAQKKEDTVKNKQQSKEAIIQINEEEANRQRKNDAKKTEVDKERKIVETVQNAVFPNSGTSSATPSVFTSESISNNNSTGNIKPKTVGDYIKEFSTDNKATLDGNWSEEAAEILHKAVVEKIGILEGNKTAPAIQEEFHDEVYAIVNAFNQKKFMPAEPDTQPTSVNVTPDNLSPEVDKNELGMGNTQSVDDIFPTEQTDSTTVMNEKTKENSNQESSNQSTVGSTNGANSTTPNDGNTTPGASNETQSANPELAIDTISAAQSKKAEVEARLISLFNDLTMAVKDSKSHNTIKLKELDQRAQPLYSSEVDVFSDDGKSIRDQIKILFKTLKERIRESKPDNNVTHVPKYEKEREKNDAINNLKSLQDFINELKIAVDVNNVYDAAGVHTKKAAEYKKLEETLGTLVSIKLKNPNAQFVKEYVTYTNEIDRLLKQLEPKISANAPQTEVKTNGVLLPQTNNSNLQAAPSNVAKPVESNEAQESGALAHTQSVSNSTQTFNAYIQNLKSDVDYDARLEQALDPKGVGKRREAFSKSQENQERVSNEVCKQIQESVKELVTKIKSGTLLSEKDCENELLEKSKPLIAAINQTFQSWEALPEEDRKKYSKNVAQNKEQVMSLVDELVRIVRNKGMEDIKEAFAAGAIAMAPAASETLPASVLSTQAMAPAASTPLNNSTQDNNVPSLTTILDGKNTQTAVTGIKPQIKPIQVAMKIYGATVFDPSPSNSQPQNNSYSREATPLSEKQSEALKGEGLKLQAPGGKVYEFSCANNIPKAVLSAKEQKATTDEEKYQLARTIVNMIDNVVAKSGTVKVDTHDPFVAEIAKCHLATLGIGIKGEIKLDGEVYNQGVQLADHTSAIFKVMQEVLEVKADDWKIAFEQSKKVQPSPDAAQIAQQDNHTTSSMRR